jgi:ATP-binding cassette, subfamily B, bacterial
VERNAFARARAFLDYRPAAKWLAILGSIASAVLYVLLLIVLALFADLLINRGRIANLAQLSAAEQEDFFNRWHNLDPEQREAAIQHVGFGDFENIQTPDQASRLSTADRGRYALYKALVEPKDNLPPPPAQMTREDLAKWAEARGVKGDPYFAAMIEHELRWRGYVWLVLRDRVNEQAANSYQPPLNPGEEPPLPALGTGNRDPHGVLSLVVRRRHSTSGKLLGLVASVNPWMWRASGGVDPNQRYLTGLMFVGLLLVLLRVGSLVLMNIMAGRTTVEAVTRLRRAVYHHSSRVGSLGLRPSETNDTRGLFTRHIEAVHEALNAWLTAVFRYPVQFVLLLAVALIAHPLLAITSILFALLVWLLGGQLAAAFRRESREASRRAATRLLLLLESMKLLRLVKAYLMELFNQSRIERQLAEYARAHARRYRGDALARPILVLLGWMAAITLLYLAGRMVLTDSVGVANLLVLFAALVSLYFPIRAYFEERKVLRRGRESAARIFEFLDRKSEIAQLIDAEFLPGLSNQLDFRDVSLREAASGRMLLKGVNITVRAGQQVGIVGPDQDEKLALVYLLPRFLDPTSGEVRIDGRNLKWVTLDSLRAQIGLVLQNSLIFNDTVANNIGCGDPGFTAPQIIEAAKLAHAHKFIQNLPYGYETPIGELGHSLRLGEQYRIALARAILRDPSVMVIEEPPLPLDDDTKALVDDTFDRFLSGRTVLYLPHRISTLKSCDVVYLLNGGTIEAWGTHKDLLQTSSMYRHIHYIEFNVFADQV